MSNALSVRIDVESDAMPEEWRDVIGYEGRYQVSDSGRIWSSARGAILPGYANVKGYVRVCLCNGTTQHFVSIHSIVALAFIGPRPKRMQIDHIDCDKRNNSVGNLEYVSMAENLRRAKLAGRLRVHAKLTSEQVSVIRRHVANGTLRTAELAICFNVNRSTIQCVALGKTYSHF